MAKILHSRGQDITAEACAWLAQLETGDLTAADIEAFREWLRRSPRHVAEIRRIANMSLQLNVLTGMVDPIREAMDKYEPIIGKTRESVFLRFRPAALVFSVLIVFAVAFTYVSWNNTHSQSMLITTETGEIRPVHLSDGTLVELNTDSRIEITYDRYKRRVRLLQGEAYFKVVHDSARPFLVYAGDKYVRDIGTAFVVRLLQENLNVTVFEGRIELAETPGLIEKTYKKPGSGDINTGKSGKPADTATMLKAGQAITLADGERKGKIMNKSANDLKRRLAWKEGLLDFSNTPLEEVIKELNRYSKLRIKIADPHLKTVKFGGIFRIDQTNQLLDALQASYGIRVERLSTNEVRLSKAESTGIDNPTSGGESNPGIN